MRFKGDLEERCNTVLILRDREAGAFVRQSPTSGKHDATVCNRLFTLKL